MDRRPKDNWNVMSVVFAILRVKSAVLQDIIASCGGLNKSGPVQLTPAFWDLVDHFNQEWEREIGASLIPSMAWFLLAEKHM